ncbi:MAG TPA: hypothetical protein VI485_01740 [Vicinamibacterales bacterium]|nr:hypothetical protein [Vicinamibacterales bacterium]
MPKTVTVQVLDVGQGSGNLIEIRNTGFGISALVLIDLGSELNYDTAGKAAAQYVVDTLNGLGPAPVLEAVFLTHSDKDHINLLGVLLDNFDPPSNPFPTKKVLTISRLIYGGDRNKYKKHKKNYLTLAEKYLPAGVSSTSISADGSDFTPGVGWTPGFAIGDVPFYIIVANTTPDAIDLVEDSPAKLLKLPGGYTINTKSLVIDVFYNTIGCVITGDATGLTMAYCNQVMTAAGHGQTTFMLTMPHHASEFTTFDLGGIETDTLDRDQLAERVVDEFAAHMAAETVTASADQQKVFKHPSMNVIEAFRTRLSPNTFYPGDVYLLAGGIGNHFYNVFVKKGKYNRTDPLGHTQAWPNRNYWFTMQTTSNIFTTTYYLADQQPGLQLPPFPPNSVPELKPPFGFGPPPRGAQWSFVWSGPAAKSIARRDNRAVLAASAAAGHRPVEWPQEVLDTFGARRVDERPAHVPASEVASWRGPRAATVSRQPATTRRLLAGLRPVR